MSLEEKYWICLHNLTFKSQHSFRSEKGSGYFHGTGNGTLMTRNAAAISLNYLMVSPKTDAFRIFK